MLLNILVMSIIQILIGTLFVSASSVHSQSLDCGVPVDSPESRGAAGKHPKQGSWPWMAAIFKTKNGRADDLEMYCSGVLITRRHVLTTAHCVESQKKPTEYEVRVGNSDWSKADKYSVETIQLHEQYNARRFYGDLAILKLDRPAADANVNVVCLPEGKMATGNLTGSLATVAGWTQEHSGVRVSNLLPSAESVPIISNWECNRTFSKLSHFRRQFNLGISPAFLCASSNQNTCGMLSGSPLMLKSEGKWQAVGILTFGYGCGASGYPEGFTRVSHYLDWIKRNTASYKHSLVFPSV